MKLFKMIYEIVFEKEAGRHHIGRVGIEKTWYLLVPKDIVERLRNCNINLENDDMQVIAQLILDRENYEVKILYSFRFPPKDIPKWIEYVRKQPLTLEEKVNV
ncbi:MAG: hypothetical protein QXP04_00340 [Candidatus Nanoarchaeia archaeon]|nr:hypothetical protein [Candidatus Jingweiarchaeum tengchongense]